MSKQIQLAYTPTEQVLSYLYLLEQMAGDTCVEDGSTRGVPSTRTLQLQTDPLKLEINRSEISHDIMGIFAFLHIHTCICGDGRF